MNVWFPFCSKDLNRAIEWLSWCAELGMHRHPIYLHPAMELQGCPAQVQELARKAFERVEIVPDREGHEGWPQGPNSCFRQAAWFFFLKEEDWFYMESDCWPLTPGPQWLDQIEAEWQQAKQAGKFFMGDLLPGGNGYAEHMSGNAVWSWQTPNFSAKMMTAEHGAFDIVDPGPIVAAMHRTKLIQDVFCHPPTVVPTFPNLESLAIVRPDAVLFHRNKDCTLSRRLREKRRGVPVFAIDLAVPAKFRACTYFEEVPGIDPAPQQWLLARWAHAWKECGFSPRILTRRDAENNPGFAEMNAKFEALPSVNPKGYDAACFRRYLAMVTTDGGTMVDYDVMPYGLTPDALAALTKGQEDRWPSGRFPLLLADNNPCPCAMTGTAKQYENAAVEFANHGHECVSQEQGRQHVSDQSCVQAWKWPALDLCYEMGREGWTTAKMVHYAHSCCAGRSRQEVIPEAEKLRAAPPPNKTPFLNGLPNQTQPSFKDRTAPQKPVAWIDSIRERVEFLRVSSLESANNRTRIMQEIKKAGLNVGGFKHGQPKSKKRRRQLAKV